MKPERTPMKSLDEALAELLAFAQPLTGSCTLDTFDADGRVLAQDLVSALHVPPQDNSSMDGYALRCADVPRVGSVLAVTQRIPAGSSGAPLELGTAARIFTGAPIPAGADAVVMQEACEAIASDATLQAKEQVRIQALPQPGQWIRRAGEDVALGAVVLLQASALHATSPRPPLDTLRAH